MSNILDTGGVLPHGLLGHDAQAIMEGHNKSYKNTAMRVGVIVASYPVSDSKNRSKLAPEYDVAVVEQQEDKGSTTILYRNCLSAEGFGSIADYFERTLRPKKKKTRKGDAESMKGQNGAIVLILCMDGMSEKGVIIGQLTHPDRKTKLVDEKPYLEGEYNGVNVKIENSGACTLVFKGATDNDGKIVDTSQGPTTAKIEKDGSFQLDHKTIKLRLDKNGIVTLTSTNDINVTTDTNINVKATKNISVQCVDVNVKASGNANVDVGKDANIKTGGKTVVKAGGTCEVTSGGKTMVKAPGIDLNNPVSGITTENSHFGVVDFITGVPVEASKTVKSDV